MSDREPEEGPEGRPGEDPVNHHPPEEWRPGDPGDPFGGGPRPPGEPPRSDGPGDPYHDPSGYGGAAPGPPSGTEGSGGRPTMRPPRGEETGELSEGPNGPGGAGYENSGYPPGQGGYPDTPYAYGNRGANDGRGAGFSGPPPVPPTPWGKILGIGCGVLLLLLLVLGGCGAVMIFMSGTGSPEGPGGPVGPGEGAQEDPRGEETPSNATLDASSTDFQPSSLYVEGEFTSVRVRITNDGERSLDVNPLYFTVVDTSGEEHAPGDAIAMDAREISVQTLESGQNAEGVITVEGTVEPESVVFEPFHTIPVEVPVE
ncbi:DUF4352 domain-containing protein [Nocardiopsis alba]|uniref:DUF4352 domain-containing protein n=1 Tax=Nocardiopsis alba TaxID=53437 RepID=UPI0033CBC452